MPKRSVEDLARDAEPPTPKDGVSARLRVAMANPTSEAILTFRLSKEDAALIERVVEALADKKAISRGQALAEICRRAEKKKR